MWMKIGVKGKAKFNSISKKYNLILVLKEYSQAVKIIFDATKITSIKFFLLYVGITFEHVSSYYYMWE